MKENPIPKEEITKLAEETAAYLTSPEGQKELREAFARGQAEAERLKEAATPDPQALKQHFNI